MTGSRGRCRGRSGWRWGSSGFSTRRREQEDAAGIRICHDHKRAVVAFAQRDTRLPLRAAQRLRQLFDTLDRPASRTFVHVVEEPDEFLGDVTLVADQYDQTMTIQSAGFQGAGGFGIAAQ